MWRDSSLLSWEAGQREILGTQNPGLMHFCQAVLSIKAMWWVLCFLCFKSDPCGGISWLSIHVLLSNWTGRLVLCQIYKEDSIVFSSGMTSHRGWRAPCVRKQLCPKQLSGGHAHCSLRKEMELKLLDSQELCLSRVCQPSRGSPGGQQACSAWQGGLRVCGGQLCEREKP